MKNNQKSESRDKEVSKNFEIYFKGTLTHGKDFEIKQGGLCCEMVVIHTEDWKLKNPQKPIQSQISFLDDFTEEFVFAQNFEYYFSSSKIDDWPFVVIRIWSLNSTNKLKIVGYTKFKLPIKSGFHYLKLEVIKPIGNYEFFEKQFYEDDNIDLDSLDTLKFNTESLQLLNAQSNGNVFLEIEVSKRFFYFAI